MRFRWSAKHHRTPGRNTCPTAAPLDATVVGEAYAILEGRVLDKLWAAGVPIPAWAWLNALAHRPIGEIGDLIGVACDQPGDRWADTVVGIAVELSRTEPAPPRRPLSRPTCSCPQNWSYSQGEGSRMGRASSPERSAGAWPAIPVGHPRTCGNIPIK
jgi:hypothetical protein